MGTKIYKKIRNLPYTIYLVSAMLIIGGCVSTTPEQTSPPKPDAPIINSFIMIPSKDRTIIDINTNEPTQQTSFDMDNPQRIVIDIRGTIGKDLPLLSEFEQGNVESIQFEKGETQAFTTRATIGLAGKVDYNVKSDDNKIKVVIIPETKVSKDIKQTEDIKAKPDTETVTPSEPRIFVQPKEINLNQILGIDFTRLNHGRSRLIITTDKKTPYDLKRKGSKTLELKLTKTTIPPQLLRDLDSKHFESAIDRIKPVFYTKKQETSISIVLREMVPFHVKQTDNNINIDFGPSSVAPPETQIVPLQLGQAQRQKEMSPTKKQTVSRTPVVSTQRVGIPGKKRYSGSPMTLDFVNADLTNILRLIGEVSNLNIVWGPEVAGNVSMRLKKVPWDQALDLILDNNDLAQRRQGNVIWITSRAKMNQLEAEEKRKAREIEEEKKRKIEAEKQAREVAQKEQIPLITRYLPLDFTTTQAIKDHILPILSDRGKMSEDSRTNTIILTDIEEVIERARELVKQFDTPVKQILIEARIVDATDDLTRDLGIVWDQETSAWKKNQNVPVTVPPNATDFTSSGLKAFGGTFMTNVPAAGWAGNIGLNFAKLSASGLGALTLDARLALAESNGTGKTIQAPKVIATEGSSASISAGDSIIIPATENVASTTIDATLSLTVTPATVSYNNYITLDVSVTDDQAPSSTRLKKKAISTTLMIKSGETIVIGGIYKEVQQKDESGIPYLKDIPVLGYLFKATRNTNNKSELLIFITPTVLPSPQKEL